MKIISILTALFLVGCGGKQKKAESHKDTPIKTTIPAQVVHEVKKVGPGFWKEFGVSSSVYRPDVEHGSVYGVDGSLLAFKTIDGVVWFGNFEPRDNKPPLETRKVYLVCISGNPAKGCGYAMRNLAVAPPQCVLEERVVGWKEARGFLEPRTPNSELFWLNIEDFLRSREWK